MNNIPNSPVKGRLHPLMILAALAVLLFCMVGTAAIMGWIPSSIGGNANRQLSEADRAALAATLPQGAPQPAPGVVPMAPAQQAGMVQGYAPQAQPGVVYPAQPAPQAYVQQPQPVVVRDDPEPASKTVHKKATQVAAADNGRNWCSNCGNVESVRTIKQRAEGSGLGAAGGAVLGGLLGNQIGDGSGRKIATVAGAVGGAVVGNQVEGNMKATTSYEIRVRLDDGTLRTFRQSSPPQWRSGDRVRIVKGRLRSVA
ncbi:MULTISPECIES: glycine zipper 2TM domain-containing protein [unclassified Massilia]|uniref:glycine zipper 2TM domain-containing protein n=1 Tax=unclassified Massilia TaxID=2609279 RepID=UPI001B81E133|nr:MULTISPECIES: glycine zipper 2TM domain-containing protein [unclassified Massilia]MBQ5941693.1 glycine zipper 2TM domain-containing protein [Massilia sp. AB1]MBQ5962896.1 glycine zipper 2TM domain-containing protein [Massilia sp. ZL223]